MKATGIVRRIDDLGRVVIPKEIRRTMRIREGDPLEIYTDRDGEVIFKKYSPMGELGTFAGELAEALSRTAGLSCAICDRDAVIAAAGGAKKDIFEKTISNDLETLMEQRHVYEHTGSDDTLHVSENDPYQVVVAAPIISEGDVTGCVALLSDSTDMVATEVESKLRTVSYQGQSLFPSAIDVPFRICYNNARKRGIFPAFFSQKETLSWIHTHMHAMSGCRSSSGATPPCFWLPVCCSARSPSCLPVCPRSF